MYEWLLFGHLIGVVLLVGGFAAFAAGIDRLARTHSLAELRAFVAVATFGERLVLAGGVCLIPFGLIMAARYWSFSDGWIVVSVGLVLVQGATGSTVVSPRLRRLHAALAQAPIPGSAVPVEVAVLARDRVMHAGARASVSIIIEIVFLMTVKPSGMSLMLSLLVAVSAATILGAIPLGKVPT